MISLSHIQYHRPDKYISFTTLIVKTCMYYHFNFFYFNAQFKLLTPSQVNSPLLFAASQLQYGRLTLLGAGGLNPSSLLCEIFLHEPS